MARGQNLKRPAGSEGSVSGGRNAQLGGIAGVGITDDHMAPSPPPSNPAINPPNLTATSTSTAKRPGTSSLALKTRRYIDININDVRNERARGKWTEEDDRMWKRTKPYECEICGERGSTRVSLFSHIGYFIGGACYPALTINYLLFSRMKSILYFRTLELSQ